MRENERRGKRRKEKGKEAVHKSLPCLKFGIGADFKIHVKINYLILSVSISRHTLMSQIAAVLLIFIN